MKNIVFITDENYIIPTKTAINSIIKNVTDTDITVNVIAVDISDENKKAISSLQSNNVQTKIISVNNQFADLGLDHLYVSKAALFKFQLPEIFPCLDTILYADGDMIFHRGFEDIFSFDISGYYAAVVQDMLATELEGWAKCIGHEKYFNSGIMYINLKKWREDSISEKLLEYKKNDSDGHFMDQNALNAVIGNNVQWISPYFNYMSTCTINTFEKLYKDGKAIDHIAQFYNILPTEMKKIMQNPAILHVTSPKKVWKDVSSDRIDDWIPYALPEDFIKIVKGYCLIQAKEITKLKEEISHIKNEKEKIKDMLASMRGEGGIYSYSLGNTICFKTGGNAAFYILSGFSNCEQWGCWTNGNKAELKFVVNGLSRDLILDMDYNVFAEQHILIFINKKFLIEYDAVSGRKKVRIPKDMMQDNELVLTFEIPNAKSPKELNISTDNRCLGLGFKKMLFHKKYW